VVYLHMHRLVALHGQQGRVAALTPHGHAAGRVAL